jgi:pyrroline-5-carboxylate reductase
LYVDIPARRFTGQHLRQISKMGKILVDLLLILPTLLVSSRGTWAMPGEIPTVGFLGAGQMATALARGWVAAGLLQPHQIIASDPLPKARQTFTDLTRARSTASNLEVLQAGKLLVLAVKPQFMPALLAEIREKVTSNHIVVSIAAGMTLKQLADVLGNQCRLIRVMPNTPCLVGASASAFSLGENAHSEDAVLVERLFNAVGLAFRLPENLLDAVTGLSGSGPAYVYVMIEALSDGGVRMGLPRDVANALAAQTVLGAAKMVLETGSHTSQLKDHVASPAGTTIAGLHALERGGVRAALMNAVEAATHRARELGSQ